MSMLVSLLLLIFLPNQDTRTENWKEDLHFFQQQFKAKHVKPFARLSEAEFDSAIQQIQPDKLTDQQVILKLWQILARVGDSHSRINPPNSIRMTQYPLAVMHLTDGWYVWGIDQSEKQVLQGKLIKIGNTPIDEACKKLMTIITAENPSQAQIFLKQFLVMPEPLQFVGILPPIERATFTILDKHQVERTVTLVPITSKRPVWELAIQSKTWPAHLQQNRPPNGLVWLQNNNALYVWYDRCAENPKYPLATWTKDVLQSIDEKQPRKVVIDLRRNGGGNSVLLEPLINQLAKQDINHRDKLAVLIGPATFSSAMMNAFHFRTRTNALLVGEPTGGSPNHPGEVRTFTLPHSKCVVQYSTKLFQLTKDNATTLTPDRLITPTSEGFFADHDEVLNQVLQP